MWYLTIYSTEGHVPLAARSRSATWQRDTAREWACHATVAVRPVLSLITLCWRSWCDRLLSSSLDGLLLFWKNKLNSVLLQWKMGVSLKIWKTWGDILNSSVMMQANSNSTSARMHLIRETAVYRAPCHDCNKTYCSSEIGVSIGSNDQLLTITQNSLEYRTLNPKHPITIIYIIYI